jgi:hypothetical protein
MEKANIKVTSVEVVPAKPDAADLRKIKHYAETRSKELKEVALVYKIYLASLPEPAGQAYGLYIGDHHVRKYSSFEKGIFFVVNDPDLAQSLAGKEICFDIPIQKELLRSGVRIPAGKIKALEMEATNEEHGAAELPTKLQVLSQ